MTSVEGQGRKQNVEDEVSYKDVPQSIDLHGLAELVKGKSRH